MIIGRSDDRSPRRLVALSRSVPLRSILGHYIYATATGSALRWFTFDIAVTTEREGLGLKNIFICLLYFVSFMKIRSKNYTFLKGNLIYEKTKKNLTFLLEIFCERHLSAKNNGIMKDCKLSEYL